MQTKIVAKQRRHSETPHVSHIDFGPDQSTYRLSSDEKTLTIILGNQHGVADGKMLHTFLLGIQKNTELKEKLKTIKKSQSSHSRIKLD